MSALANVFLAKSGTGHCIVRQVCERHGKKLGEVCQNTNAIIIIFRAFVSLPFNQPQAGCPQKQHIEAKPLAWIDDLDLSKVASKLTSSNPASCKPPVQGFLAVQEMCARHVCALAIRSSTAF